MQTDVKDLKILAVDDSFQALNLIRTMLSDLGVHEVYTANDGKEAMDFLDLCDDMVDVVLCDWRMPHMNGLDLLRQVRTVDASVPFLMVSGAADMDKVLAARGSGVTGFIKKPFSKDELEKKLKVVSRMVRFMKSPNSN
jgi:two-component system chemotaxis response regulator CheY